MCSFIYIIFPCSILSSYIFDRRAVSTASKALLRQRRCGGAGWRWGAWSFILRSAQQEEALHRIWSNLDIKIFEAFQGKV
ncbi:unnamed protein product [Spirodela intermedia]|uniref:Uncharacterized protein n=1 Tax=Spirodela intermedia TaxID=51605 RepID=A0A7I8JBI9_SPIIN|nr:unnamed protein product [Spirodela intermedia]CAA6667547.1 unnamed protein product [Spirodela intermedia]